MNIKKIHILVILLILTSIFASGCILQKTVKWKEYSNNFYPDYIINYPDHMEVSEAGQDNRLAIISTPNYEIDMTNGKIASGFAVKVTRMHFDSLKKSFNCNKSEFKNCILANSLANLDYQQGEVKTEPITINDYPGIKYEFISNAGKNNNVGLVVEKDNKYYVALIVYRNQKDMELFNQILDSFRFKT
jgi:hypothetical protein